MNNLDDQLINKEKSGKKEAASDRAGKYLEATRGSSSDAAEEAGSSLRERIFKKKKEAESGAADKVAEVATAPIRKGTSKLLQQAWLNLADSFGLTLIWIDIHVWLGTIFGNKFFCKLGQEWLDSSIVSAENEYAKSQGQMLGTVEPMVTGCCNVGCLFILLCIGMIIAMIVGVITNPLEALSAAFGYLWQFLTGK